MPDKASVVVFADYHEVHNAKRHGILCPNGDMICTCCGHVYDKKDRGIAWDIVKQYSKWRNLSTEVAYIYDEVEE